MTYSKENCRPPMRGKKPSAGLLLGNLLTVIVFYKEIVCRGVIVGGFC